MDPAGSRGARGREGGLLPTPVQLAELVLGFDPRSRLGTCHADAEEAPPCGVSGRSIIAAMGLDRACLSRCCGAMGIAASVACSVSGSRNAAGDASARDAAPHDSGAVPVDARAHDAVGPRMDGGSDSSSDAGEGGLTAGSDTTETLLIGGLTRTFIVHLPQGYADTAPVPVVFDYHPLGVTAGIWKLATTWSATADAQGFIVVWPQGYMGSWNVGRCCDPALGADVDDVAFTRAILARLSAQARVDAKRVYATGCSNGGGMAYKIACDAADVIAAVAPVDFDCVTGAGSNPSCGDCTPSRPISECQFRGTNDMDVPYDGGPTPVVAGLVFPGAQTNFATWAGIDDCAGSPATDGIQPACQTYSTCGGGADVTLCTVPDGTHCGSYASFPIVDTAWAMFQEHALP